jgi:hypothetical protein
MPTGVLSSRGAAQDASPWLCLPSWHYLTDHSPRDSEWPRKAKNILEFTTLGAAGWAAQEKPGVEDEPIGIDETAVAGSRTDNAQDCADYYAVAHLFGAGATLHTQALGIDGVLPGAVAQGCCEAVRDVWAYFSNAGIVDAQTGQYTRGGLADCPIVHDDALALRTFGMIQGNKAVVVPVRRQGGWALTPVAPWVVSDQGGYNQNVIVLTR